MEHLQEYKSFVSMLPGIRKDKTFKLTDDLDVEDNNMMYYLPKGSEITITNIINGIVYFLYRNKIFHLHQRKLESYI